MTSPKLKVSLSLARDILHLVDEVQPRDVAPGAVRGDAEGGAAQEREVVREAGMADGELPRQEHALVGHPIEERGIRVNGAPILQLSTIAVAFRESSGR